MQWSTVYNVFIRDFRKQKKRITLTIVALCWGTISIMLLLGFGEGLHHQLSINNKGMGDGLAVLWPGQTSIPYKGLGKGRAIRFVEDDIEYIKSRIPELREVGGEYQRWGAEIRYGTRVVSEHVNGVTPNYEEMRYHIPRMGGRMINDLDMRLKRRVVFLGERLMERLFGTDTTKSEDEISDYFSGPKETVKAEDVVGKEVLINGIPFTVVGVMVHKMQMNSYEGMDEDKATIPLTTFRAIFGDPWLDNMIYAPYDLDQMKAVEVKVREALAAKYKFDPKDERALSLWDVAASNREMNNVLLGIKIFLGIIGGLTLLIASVGVANIMYVSIKERTREIGIKMAVGARRIYILTQFLLEAILITFTGGFLGMGISIAATEIFKRIDIKSDVLSFMGRPTISIEIGLIVVSILGIMGLLAGLFPAMRAASVSPVESLRYE
ncbi:MAG: ABC transporter permease [Candidatus Zixiibacteriota bacterium]